MSSNSLAANLGLFVPLPALPGKAPDLHNFLMQGYKLVQNEPLTNHWFAIKYATNTTTSEETYAIFDTSAAEEGRNAHLTGEIAKALMANAPGLLVGGPQINKVDVLASKVDMSAVKSAAGGTTEGLKCGLRVLFSAKEDKVEAVKQFLIDATPLIAAETFTPIWYAIHFPSNPTMFGIIDFFDSSDGRTAHLGGKVAEALFAEVGKSIEATPDVVEVDIIAAMVRR